MLKAIVAFTAVIGTVLGGQKFSYNGETWKQEFDIVDYGKMDLQTVWKDWREYFGKKYTTIDEEYQRFGIFLENIRKIAMWNTNSNDGASLRPNQFTDLTSEEFVKYVHGKNGKCFTGKKPQYNIGKSKKENQAPRMKTDPASVDWTTQGVVTPVKNQGDCGSCWAFSATGSMECNYAIQHGSLNSLSEQQLMDCSYDYGNLGCSGGEMDNAFKYAMQAGGICSEAEYPYEAKDGTCKSSTCGKKYDPIVNFMDVSKQNETALEDAVARGCVSVGIEADQFAFQYYSSGVLTGTCGTNLDHGVLVVGYGVDNGQSYWKVKNSWGTDWGMEGYVLICKDCPANGDQGECGIYDDPSYPIT
jgi:C1A family cysteine protease